MKSYFTFLILAITWQELAASNILFIMKLGSASHVNTILPVMEALSAKGHNVTFLSMLKPQSNIKHKINVLHLQTLEDHFWSKRMNSFEFQGMNFIKNIASETDLIILEACTLFYDDKQTKAILKDGTKFDIVVIDPLLSECILPMIKLLGDPPFIYYCTCALYPWLYFSLDIPSPPSWIPAFMMNYNEEMAFTERVLNYLSYWGMLLYRYGLILPRSEQVIKQIFPGKDFPSLEEIEQNVSLVLANSDSKSLDLSKPTAPFLFEVPATHCRPPSNLPKELKEFFDSSGSHGVIYFSLGSNVFSKEMPKEKIKAFLSAFKRLKQKVLWKFEEDLPNLPSNVKISKWLPQQDILGHPKTKLFISQGGQLSIQESICHGVPVLGLPVFGDQVPNIFNGMRKGFANHLDFYALNESYIYETITNMLNDKRYKESSMRYSSLIKDSPMKSTDVAVYWIEYVIRHKGSRHLRFHAARKLNWLQYFSLDVLSLCCIVLAMILYISYKILKVFFKVLLWPFRSKKTVTNSNSKKSN